MSKLAVSRIHVDQDGICVELGTAGKGRLIVGSVDVEDLGCLK